MERARARDEQTAGANLMSKNTKQFSLTNFMARLKFVESKFPDKNRFRKTKKNNNM